ncbi:unnamed protein product [Chrysoparadoxa australica]
MVESRLEPLFQPISNEPPSEADLANDRHLLAFMYDAGNVPVMPKADLKRRERALNELTVLCCKWVYDTYKDMFSEEVAKEAGGKMLVSGSYRLGIHEPGSDIDAVFVAPQHCDKGGFFTVLKKTLTDHPEVTNLNAISTAAVPIITFDFDEINIDLGLACLPVNSVAENIDIDNDSILSGVDPATEKCVNGPRVTNMIHRLVPNYESFLPVVRCIRLWAKKNGLYGNKMGYFGGVNVNILVAFVSQLYPKASPASLLCKFFKVMSSWDWPNPIHLTKPIDAGMGLECWQAQHNPWHVMPIITPAYPAMNSSLAVNQHSLAVIMREFARADKVCSEIVEDGGKDWGKLFGTSNFFISYSHYLAVDIMASGEVDFLTWKGYIESRLRKLLETFSWMKLPMKNLHLFPEKFAQCCCGGIGGELPAHCLCYFIGFELDKMRMKGKKLDLTASFARFEETALKFMGYKEGMHIALTPYTQKRLPAFVFESLGGKAKAAALRKERKAADEAEKKKLLDSVAAAAEAQLKEKQMMLQKATSSVPDEGSPEAAADAAQPEGKTEVEANTGLSKEGAMITAEAATGGGGGAAAAAAAAGEASLSTTGDKQEPQEVEDEAMEYDEHAEDDGYEEARPAKRMKRTPESVHLVQLRPVVPKWRQLSDSGISSVAKSKKLAVSLLPSQSAAAATAAKG